MSSVTEPKLETGDAHYEEANGAGNSSVAGGIVDDDDDDEGGSGGKSQKERRKIEIKFIQDKSRRHITFSKRKAGIMKKAYELSVLTGTQVLLLVVSETGLVYTFTTPKLQPLVTKSEGKNLIQACLNAPEEGLGDDGGDQSDGQSQESPDQSPVPQQQQPGQPGQHPGQVQQRPPPQQQGPPPPQQQLPPGAHMPHQGPYPGQGHPQPGMLPPNAYGQDYQYFANIPNNNIPNQQHYQ
ncbi:SRF-type transcription factor (DNA-binding and dimerization domain)-domain-containing protein [Scheffersomyces amazonensis]|uniref:SRF-type transcription factor (DNA-binding and dimerization domain)-domain-containing protein n=1 Tax=Scheffersomyces amazonensis TaxID=1078765 RepID=UPI00315DB9DC